MQSPLLSASQTEEKAGKDGGISNTFSRMFTVVTIVISFCRDPAAQLAVFPEHLLPGFSGIGRAVS